MRPEQKRAYDMVRAAKHKGLIVPPAECNRCKEPTRYGKDGRSLLHGHHHDYSKPLDVEWICVKCHRIETRCPKGEEHCRSKLTSKLVQAAILLHDSGFLLTDIADFYGVSRQAVSHAVTGKNWKEEREMTDKIQQARRELFEAWTKSEHGDLTRRQDGEYFDDLTHGAWLGFNAALDLALIKLPPAFDDVHNYACYQGGWNDMRGEAVDAIESTNLGIKVK